MSNLNYSKNFTAETRRRKEFLSYARLELKIGFETQSFFRLWVK